MATEIIRPDAVGDETNLEMAGGGALYNWQCVDEEVSDGTSTVVRNMAGADENWKRDLYNFGAPSGSGTISKITVKARCWYVDIGYPPGNAELKLAVKLSGSVSESDAKAMTSSEAEYSEDFTEKPGGGAWTVADLADVQAGPSLSYRYLDSKNYSAGVCTQVWIVIEYAAVIEVSVADGFSLGDAPSLGQLLDLALSDGVSLGDAPSVLWALSTALSDGVKVGDSPSVLWSLATALTDGLTLGDAPSLGQLLQLSLADGLKLGDTALGVRAFLLALADGLKLSDALWAKAYHCFESYTAGDAAVTDISGATAWRAQTFTPSTAHVVTSVKLKILRVGSPGTVTVSIRATSAGKPTGGDLCSGTTNGDTLTTDSLGEWREISLGNGYPLAASTQYAIVVRALNGDSSNKVRWRYDDSGEYSGGDVCTTGNGGVSWTIISGDDVLFQECGYMGAQVDAAVTDGLSLGDASSVLQILRPLLTDGLSLGDTPAVLQALGLTASDGLHLGDTTSVLWALSTALTDGLKLGDTVSQVRLVLLAALDGLNLGDVLTYHPVILAALTDGLKLGDTPATWQTLNLALSDGLNLGDTASALQHLLLSLNDGLTLGDVADRFGVYNLDLADGLSVGDQAIAKAIFQALAEDGIVLGEDIETLLTLMGYVLRLLLYTRPYRKLTVFTRPYRQLTVFTRPYRQLSTHTRPYRQLTTYTRPYRKLTTWVGERS